MRALVDNVLDLKHGGHPVMVPLAGHNVHLGPLHWETISFITSTELNWGIGSFALEQSLEEIRL